MSGQGQREPAALPQRQPGNRLIEYGTVPAGTPEMPRHAHIEHGGKKLR